MKRRAANRRSHYHFFDDPDNDGRDAVFGLDESLEAFVNALKSAAKGYGIEKRVLLLHGPVGSSKSTIARLLKRGLERYSATDDGRRLHARLDRTKTRATCSWCPMHEEPLHLIPERFRDDVTAQLNAGPGRRRIPRSASSASSAPTAASCTPSG